MQPKPQPKPATPPTRREPVKATLVNVDGGLNSWLAAQRTEIMRALPRKIDPDQFIRICLTTVKQDSYLMEADPISFLAAVFEAASAGLVIDGVLGHAYLVSFFSKKRGCRLVEMIPGYKGLMDLARRSGEIAKIEARVVRANDRFRFAYGINQVLEHTPADEPDERARWTHVYALAWYKDPNIPPQFVVLSYAEVMAIKARSASVVAGRSSPWDTDEEAMAMKTAVRRLAKWLPLTPNDQRIVEKDELRDSGVRLAEFEVRSSPSTVADLSQAKQEPAQDGQAREASEERDEADDGLGGLAGEPLTPEEMDAADRAAEAARE